jgi:uncharacterized protein YjiS (DUF1127 family)
MASTTFDITNRGGHAEGAIRTLVSRAALATVDAADRGIQALRAASRRRRTMASLEALSDEMLHDIGLTRAEIGRVSRGR